MKIKVLWHGKQIGTLEEPLNTGSEFTLDGHMYKVIIADYYEEPMVMVQDVLEMLSEEE